MICEDQFAFPLQISNELVTDSVHCDDVSKDVSDSEATRLDHASNLFDGTIESSPTTLQMPQQALEATTSQSRRQIVHHKLHQNSLDLASFLIYRACGNTTLVNYFYW